MNLPFCFTPSVTCIEVVTILSSLISYKILETSVKEPWNGYILLRPFYSIPT